MVSSSLEVSNNVHMINLQSNARLVAYVFLFDNMKEIEMGGKEPCLSQ